jgi:hypothetical protein
MDETSLHPTFQESFAVGLNFQICHLNIEGISASKSDYLSRLMREHEIDIVAIQKTQKTSEQRPTTRIQTNCRYPQQLSKPTNLLTYDPIHNIFGPLNRIIESKMK